MFENLKGSFLTVNNIVICVKHIGIITYYFIQVFKHFQSLHGLALEYNGVVGLHFPFNKYFTIISGANMACIIVSYKKFNWQLQVSNSILLTLDIYRW